MNKGKQIAEKALEKLGALIKIYSEVVDTISAQKAFQTIDYNEVLLLIDKAIADAEILEKVISKNKIEIENLESLILALKKAMYTYRPIVVGLGNKANRTGKYGWLKYRKDLNAHDEARKALARHGKAFWANVETISDEPIFIEVSAQVLDPLSDDVLVEKMEIPQEDYNRFKDDEGYVYAMRAYEEGKPKTMLLEKTMWESMKNTFVVTPEQRKRDTNQLMASILGNSGDKKK